MKKFKRIVTLLVIALLLTNCGEEKIELNKEIELTGKVTTKEVVENDEVKKISIFTLEEPVIINGEKIHKIELDYDKDLKNNSEITIKGILKGNKDSNSELNYSFSVDEIDDILSYINTFSNDEFSMTIPADLIKISTVEKIENGFIVYSTANMENGGEVFRIISVSNAEFKKLNNNEKSYIEKITSTKEKTVIIQYPTTIEYSEESFGDYEKIASQINIIKNNVRLK
jgi:hypothetical protein